MSQDLEAFKAGAIQTAGALIDSPLLQGVPHSVAMEALLIAFGALARYHACCLPNAARASTSVAERLTALAEGVPSGSHVH